MAWPSRGAGGALRLLHLGTHTLEARNTGATEGEIQEAVAIAAYTRHWSTVLNGMQIDLDEFKAKLGDVTPAPD